MFSLESSFTPERDIHGISPTDTELFGLVAMYVFSFSKLAGTEDDAAQKYLI